MSPVLVALLLAASGTLAGEEAIRWERDFDTAIRRAQVSRRPVLVDFRAEWCGWCHRLDQTTYVDPRVIELAREFVSVRIDTEGTPEEVAIAIRYGVTTLPTITFLSPSGHQLFRVTGYQGPGTLPETLEKALTVSQEVQAWEVRLERHRNDSESLHRLGVHLFEQKYYDQSRTLLERATKGDKKQPGEMRKLTRLYLGIIQTFDRHYEDAEQLFGAALEIEPHDAEQDALILYFLARTYYRWGRDKDSMRTAEELIELHDGTKVADKARELLAALRRRGVKP